MNRITAITTLFIVSLVFAGCSSQTKVESDLGIRGAPDWVNEGTRAIDNKKGRLLHGVGMASPMNDSALQKATADNRARAEIARILSTFIDSTISDYSGSVGDESDMNVERDIRGTSQLALSGAIIIGNWKDKNTGDVYSFAELDVKKMDKLVETATTLSDSFKRYYRENVAANFDRFVKNRESSE